MKLIDSLILFGSLGLLVIWSDQFIYKNISFLDSYFLLMFGLGGLMFFVYRRGKNKLKEKDKKENKK